MSILMIDIKKGRNFRYILHRGTGIPLAKI